MAGHSKTSKRAGKHKDRKDGFKHKKAPGKMKQVEAWDQMPTPESAFLGPQLWDRKICMKMNEMGWSVGHSGYQQRGYSDAAHSDSGHSTPSPTNFHQVTRLFETL